MSNTSDLGFLREQGLLLGKLFNSGAFSELYHGIEIKSADVVAVKMMDLGLMNASFKARFLPREIENIRNLKHRNIIKVRNIKRSTKKVYIVMDYAPTNLRLEIERRTYVPENQARKWFCQLASALEYLQSVGLAHRDIKLDNILIDSEGSIKLCDFGFSKIVEKGPDGGEGNSTTFCGSLAYCAPEILTRMPYDPYKTDVWSLGVVLYKMVMGVMPFGEGNDLASVRRIARAQKIPLEFPPFPHTSLACQHLIQSLLTVESNRRINLMDIARSKWISYNSDQHKTELRQRSAQLRPQSQSMNTGSTLRPMSHQSRNEEFSKPRARLAISTVSMIEKFRIRLPLLSGRLKNKK